MKKKEPPKDFANVEFGNELGDLNASKIFEIPEANRKESHGKKKSK